MLLRSIRPLLLLQNNINSIPIPNNNTIRLISTKNRNRSTILKSKKVFKVTTNLKPTTSTIIPLEESIVPTSITSTSPTPKSSTSSESSTILPTSTSSTSESIIPLEETTPLIELIPVKVPHDEHGVIDSSTGDISDKIRKLFSVSAIVVTRQIELMNLFIGFEQANKYELLSPEGKLLGYLMEEELGFKGIMMRQMLKTHRAFKATVLDIDGNVLLIIHRPFSWINSRIYVSIPSKIIDSNSSIEGEELKEKIIGEVQQEWHLYRRKYNHFLKRDNQGGMIQFASTDSGFLAWDFPIKNENEEVIGSVNRNFAGFGRELFTDTGQYVLRFEGVVLDPLLPSPDSPDSPTSSSVLESPSNPTTPSQSITPPSATSSSSNPTTPSLLTTPPPLSPSPSPNPQTSLILPLSPPPSITYDQRAILLASAISIDFDYFTRSRGGGVMGAGGGGMFIPMPMGMGGSGGSEPLPSTEIGESEGGVIEEGGGGGGGVGEGGGGGWNESGDWNSGNNDVGEEGGSWNDGSEIMSDDIPMVDPWASNENSGGSGGGDEGTWSWGDLFPDE